MPFARVLLDTSLPQLDHLFDYRIPPDLEGEVVPGVRVRVPLRATARSTRAYVVDVVAESEFGAQARDVTALVSTVPVLTPEVWRLAREVADRAAGSAGDILRLAIPPRQARVEKAFLAARAATTEGPGGDPMPDSVGADRVVPRPEAVAPAWWSTAVATGGRFALTADPQPIHLPGARWVGGWANGLALLAADTVRQGRSAIVCVPDYRDVEQAQAALAAVLPPDRPALRLDSRQSDADRYRAFLAALEPEPRVILGNRSAVYAPAHRLGAILVWDDGDPLHREPLAPYVHVRDAALVRARQAGAALVLAAHGRSPATQRLVQVGWLSDPVPVAPRRPRVVLAAAEEPTAAARIPPSAWRLARDAVRSGPVLLQVGQPGHAPSLVCADCRRPARCARCGGPLRQSRPGAPPACGWCGSLATAFACPTCGGARVRPSAIGSTRTAQDLARAFPDVRIVVSDGSTPRTEVDADPALIIATPGAEPVADGGYAAVLLLDGERMLARESLFVADDCLRRWSNAAALARPHATCMLVGVSGPVAQALATWRQPDFAARELAQRQELRFPPAVRSATVSGAPELVAGAIADVASLPDVDVLGPVDEGEGAQAIVRFGYARGEDVAARLRAAIVRSAVGRRRPSAGGRPAYPDADRLRVRMDDPDVW